VHSNLTIDLFVPVRSSTEDLSKVLTVFANIISAWHSRAGGDVVQVWLKIAHDVEPCHCIILAYDSAFSASL
jgi:hypothetical protein